MPVCILFWILGAGVEPVEEPRDPEEEEDASAERDVEADEVDPASPELLDAVDTSEIDDPLVPVDKVVTECFD